MIYGFTGYLRILLKIKVGCVFFSLLLEYTSIRLLIRGIHKFPCDTESLRFHLTFGICSLVESILCMYTAIGLSTPEWSSKI